MVVGALALAACGGGSDSGADGSGDAVSGAGSSVPTDRASSNSSGEQIPPDAAQDAAPTGAGVVDLVGPDVIESADIETNLLPSVVLDDVSTGRKVNFRNLVPQDKPILLWMWAPH